MSHRNFRLALICLATLELGCNKGPDLVEHPYGEAISGYLQDLKAPIIVVARILDYRARASHNRPSKWGKDLVLGWRATIEVENVIRGRVGLGTKNIYYFNYYVSGIRQVGDWDLGSRYLFFLEHDSGVLRTICDGRSTCVIPVFTGAHPDFRPAPDEPTAHTLIDLLLTRGKGCTDKQMMEALRGSTYDKAFTFSKEYTINKLQQLVETETPPIGERACEAIVNLGYRCEALKR